MNKTALNKLTRIWEARLRKDDLGPLDLKGQVSNRGSGKLNTAERGQARASSVAEIERRQTLYWSSSYSSPLEQSIFCLWSNGAGTRTVAIQLNVSRETVRSTIRRITKLHTPPPASPRDLMPVCDPAFVSELLNSIDLKNPRFEDLPQHMQDLLQPPLSVFERHMQSDE